MLDSKLNPHLVEVNISPSLMGGAAVDKLIKGQLIADILHTVGTYPHDPKLLKKYDNKESGKRSLNGINRLSSVKEGRSRPSTAEECSKMETTASDQSSQNPFAFGSMAKMMAAQDAWRRKPEPENICMKAIGDNDAVWNMLLMIDDEFKRAETTQLIRAHPVAETAAHYNKLYFSSRFSDQFLAKWLIEGGATGPLYQYIPDKFLPPDQLLRRQKLREDRKSCRKTRESVRGHRPAPRKGHSADARLKIAAPYKPGRPKPPQGLCEVGPRPAAPLEGSSRTKAKSPSSKPGQPEDKNSTSQSLRRRVQESHMADPARPAREVSPIITKEKQRESSHLAQQHLTSTASRTSSVTSDRTDDERSSSPTSGVSGDSSELSSQGKDKDLVTSLLRDAERNLGSDKEDDAKRALILLRTRAKEKENTIVQEHITGAVEQRLNPVLKGREIDLRRISTRREKTPWP